jgi:hypothetical protein
MPDDLIPVVPPGSGVPRGVKLELAAEVEPKDADDNSDDESVYYR